MNLFHQSRPSRCARAVRRGSGPLWALASIAVAWAGLTATAAADEVYVDPEDTPASYDLQGEYSGEIVDENGEKVKYGGQIIALGDGKFLGVGYHGGLPGDGWEQKERVLTEGKLADGVVTFTVPDGGRVAELKDGAITVFDAEGKKKGQLKKVERESPTLGKKPPKGAVVLFDGTSADAFKGGQMTDDGLLKQGVTSKQKFGKHKIHIEFRTPFRPKARGQGRGNSGFYAQGRYEVQILDSFGLEGKDNECGGIYEIASPKVNMCYPPLRWQTYDVEFTPAKFDGGKKVANARMTVHHNGVLIHDDLELPRSTRASPVKEGPEPGPVYLQNHGNPVRFKNIWVVPLDE